MIWARLACAGLMSISAATAVGAAEPPATIIIVDGSGSMWNPPPGERLKKIQLVRDALKPAIGKLSKEHRLGLVAFGHRRRSDCADVERLVEPAAQTAGRILTATENIGPRGKGPLTAAIRDAAASLEKLKGPRSIILIHDDLDNCLADPCAAAEEIAQSAPGLKIHLVSIVMRKEIVQAMMCVPTTTGGRAFVVSSAGQIRAALDELLVDDAEPQTAAAAPAPAAKAPVPVSPVAGAAAARPRPTVPGLMLKARLAAGQPDLTGIIAWRVMGEDGKLVHESSGATPFVELPAGRYTVEGRFGLASATSAAEVTAAGPTDADLVLDAGIVRIRKQAETPSATLAQTLTTVWKSDGPDDAKRSAVDLGRPLVMTRGTDWDLPLPAGSYVVAVERGRQRVTTGIVVVAGGSVELEPRMTVGELQLSAVAKEGGAPLAGRLFLVYRDDPDAPTGRREVARSAALRPILTLPAGVYSVVVRYGASEFRERVTLKAGETLQRAVATGSARLTLASRIEGASAPPADGLISYRIERLDISPPEITSTTNPAPTLDLGPGRYRIEGRLGAHNAVSARAIEIGPGSTQTLTIDHRAVVARLRHVDKTGVVVADLFWEIMDATGRPILTTGQAEPVAVLAAGRYTVRIEHRGRRSEHQIDLSSGDGRVVEITAPN